MNTKKTSKPQRFVTTQQLRSILPRESATIVKRRPKDEYPPVFISNPAVGIRRIRISGALVAQAANVTVANIFTADAQAYIPGSAVARYKTVRLHEAKVWGPTGSDIQLILRGLANGGLTSVLSVNDNIPHLSTITQTTHVPFAAGKWGQTDQIALLGATSDATQIVLTINSTVATGPYIVDILCTFQ